MKTVDYKKLHEGGYSGHSDEDFGGY
jgi:hypothetical protein